MSVDEIEALCRLIGGEQQVTTAAERLGVRLAYDEWSTSDRAFYIQDGTGQTSSLERCAWRRAALEVIADAVNKRRMHEENQARADAGESS